jgi:transaldolase
MLAAMNRIQRLSELGQSVWLDFLSRDLLLSGDLRRMIEEDGVRGITSNPTIFQKAIAKSDHYDDLVRDAPREEIAESILERIMVRDVQAACDELLPTYEKSEGGDGFASIEVAPAIADDTEAQAESARRLWRAIDRPNLMVKIPGTRAGVGAIEECLAEGLNINITLLFSVDRYRDVMEAYLSALEKRLAAGARIDRVASVASFFVSRVDTKVDKLLDAMPNAVRGAAGALRGQIAIANAKVAYEEQRRIFESERFARLAAKGARPQRVLWASTSTKDPTYRDTYYVDPLIGPDTINTMTRETFEAYRDHGAPPAESSITKDVETAHRQLTQLGVLAVDLTKVTDELEREGLASFASSFDASLRAIEEKRGRLDAREPARIKPSSPSRATTGHR